MRANLAPTTASRRSPSGRTGLGHSRPASCRRPRDFCTNALLCNAGVVLSTIFSRTPGIRCSRGTTTRRRKLPTSPPAVIAVPIASANRIMYRACGLRSCS